MDVTRRVVAGWVLEERLGSGGFGEVWRARRQHVDLVRALKLVPLGDDGSFAAWRHEIVRLEGLSHPNIVRFYDADVVTDAGPYRDYAWIATELCERSLADELARRPARVLPPAEVAGLLDAMLAALAAAHEGGCVHRDVKPGNILWHASGVWKLCDFGTARLLPQDGSHPRTSVMGTLPYLSPAAHRGRQDQAADLYALGVTVHEALTGDRLHVRQPGMTDSEYVKLVLDSPPAISPGLDSDWHDVVAALIGRHGALTATELYEHLYHRHGFGFSSLASRPSPALAWRPDATTQVAAEASSPRREDAPTGSLQTPRRPLGPPPTTATRERRRRRNGTPRGRNGNDLADVTTGRTSSGSSGMAGLVALFVLILGSAGVAGVLLYSAVPNPVLVIAVVAGVVLLTVLLMAVF